MRTDNVTKLPPDPKYMPRPGYFESWKESYDKESFKKNLKYRDEVEWINKNHKV